MLNLSYKTFTFANIYDKIDNIELHAWVKCLIRWKSKFRNPIRSSNLPLTKYKNYI